MLGLGLLKLARQPRIDVHGSAGARLHLHAQHGALGSQRVHFLLPRGLAPARVMAGALATRRPCDGVLLQVQHARARRVEVEMRGAGQRRGWLVGLGGHGRCRHCDGPCLAQLHVRRLGRGGM